MLCEHMQLKRQHKFYRIRDNKGLSSILILTILGAVIAAIMLVYTASVNIASTAEANSVFRLAGRSILSEYDKKLNEKYSLLGFRGDEKEIIKKIKAYSNLSFKNASIINLISSFKKNESYYIKPEAKNIDANLKEYSLLDVNIFKNQIVKNQKKIKEIAKNITKKKIERKDEKDTKYRVLRNEIVKENLPSYGLKEDMNILESIGQDIANKINGIKNIDKFFKDKIDSSIVDSYMFSHFNSAIYQVSEEESFFRNELEYILQGGNSDKSNKDAVFRKILFIRAPLNAIHIKTDPKKSALVTELAAAGLILGPAGEALAELAIISAWSMAEAENDVKLLKDGEKVSFMKTAENFALNSPKKAIDGTFSEKTVKPKVVSGQEYYDYLRILLLNQDENTKLLRIMDLIQINMKNLYNEDFLLREYYAGFRMNAEVKNDILSYEYRY
ncbi:MAG: DUF5702 domain-containing protein [Clostridiales Family XIII bacterium]|nr:DUF5702 domain-containing protein [Clostridiales Family XIII bacterium]